MLFFLKDIRDMNMGRDTFFEKRNLNLSRRCHFKPFLIMFLLKNSGH